ncbi:MAG: thiamine biosynthesis protein ThiC [Pseudomonadota bacterium]
MEFTQKQNIQFIAVLLLLAVITQATYTLLYMVASDAPRLWLWSIEGPMFLILAAIAGSALVGANKYTLGFSAIFVSAILNVVQVGVGLTQFVPFREAAQAVEALAPATGAVFALSFFIYNGAKVLLGLSAVVFGIAATQGGLTWLGRLSVLVGVLAMVANSIVMMFGRIDAVPSGATGVLATLLLALCLFKLKFDD